MIHSTSSSSCFVVLWMIVAIYAYTAHCLYTTKTSTIWSSTHNNHNNLYKRRYGGDSGSGGGSASSLSYIREGRRGGGQLPLRQKTVVSTSRLYGIPKLFRWLIDLYPLVLESVGEGLSNNAMSVDYFYLDMNGIIHTCTHSNNDKLIPLREQEMFLRIFAYTDQLYKLVAPKKMMFLAVDGVAPRAKMNQQRSRRFRSSKVRLWSLDIGLVYSEFVCQLWLSICYSIHCMTILYCIILYLYYTYHPMLIGERDLDSRARSSRREDARHWILRLELHHSGYY